MRIVIAGGTGLLGKRLQKLFTLMQAEVLVLTTSGEDRFENGVHYVKWMHGERPEHKLENADAFINLAGVSLNDGRWTEKKKAALLSSRINSTQEIIRIMSTLNHKPAVFINASAVGIYSPSTTAVYTEESLTEESDFLSEVVHAWEQEAAKAEIFGIRTCFMRFGVLLERDAGALPMMVLPYQLFFGGTIGSGKQWVPWIHAEDAARAIAFTIETPHLRGAINVVSPNTIQMKQFGKIIGQALHRPHFFPVPSPLLKGLLGEKSILILEGQHVVPAKLIESGFTYKFPSLKNAILDLYN